MIITAAFILQPVLLAVLVFRFFRPKARTAGPVRFLLTLSALLLLTGFVHRSILIRFAALTNTYEALVFFSLGILLILAVSSWMKRPPLPPAVVFGGVLLSLLLLALSSSPIAPSEVRPPVPALQSHWLVLHVALSFLGEAFFALAFVSSVLYLVSRKEEKRNEMDRLTYRVIAVGYPVYTIGALVFGAVWASCAWGRFWSWDPKETWALVTVLVYTVYLHARLIFRKKGKALAWISVIGFAFTLFTFFGVNFLLAGLHSYR
ncbi:MAG: cytochrome c biogenesis protein CcsA [Spirochaetales bacterium]|nr:cytochrome c biogenesis protein CcsA [Spirochaetales bacterium]